MFMFQINCIFRVDFQILIKIIVEKILNDFDFQTVSISSLCDDIYQR